MDQLVGSSAKVHRRTVDESVIANLVAVNDTRPPAAIGPGKAGHTISWCPSLGIAAEREWRVNRLRATLYAGVNLVADNAGVHIGSHVRVKEVIARTCSSLYAAVSVDIAD